MEHSVPAAAAGLYIGLNALLLLWLTLHTARTRRRLDLSFGDSDDPQLQRALRGSASAVESIPIGVLLLFAMAAMASSVLTVHLFGCVFTAGRAMHGAYFVFPKAPNWMRDAGAFLTTVVIALGAVDVIAHAIGVLL